MQYWLDEDILWFPFWFEGELWHDVPIWLLTQGVWAMTQRHYPRHSAQLPLFLVGVV